MAERKSLSHRFNRPVIDIRIWQLNGNTMTGPFCIMKKKEMGSTSYSPDIAGLVRRKICINANLERVIFFPRGVVIIGQKRINLSWLVIPFDSDIGHRREDQLIDSWINMKSVGRTLLLLLLVAVVLVAVAAIPKKRKDHYGKSPKRIIKAPTDCEIVEQNDRFDCIPGFGINATETECTKRGCCWNPILDQNTTDAHRPEFWQTRFPIHAGAPSCYYAPTAAQFYPAPSIQTTDYGLSAQATLVGKSSYPGDVTNVRMDAYFETNSRLRIKIYDAVNSRYEAAIPDLPDSPLTKAADPDYAVTFHTESLGFCVTRKSTNETLFDTSVGALIFSDQYIQLSSRLANEYVYGLGDSNDRFARSLDWQIIPLFASLLFPDYGSHPFYLGVEKSHNSHGVFLHNSNGMDIFLQPTPAISYRVIGGILDFYFFLGPRPDDVIAQYTGLVGQMAMPPYWSLGFQLCRYNYNSSEITNATMMNNVNAGIPFDVQWNDIDYMEDYKLFTYDRERYDTLPTMVNEIHARNMRYMFITDVGIYVQPSGTYDSYDELMRSGAYVKSTDTDTPATGTVWPPLSVFPDWNHPNATQFWTDQYEAYYGLVKYDGAWIDMNEPTTFSEGSYDGGCPQTDLDFPPYVPALEGDTMYYSTICMSSRHYQNQSHYNLHNLYGISNAIATHSAMVSILKKRPFIISRSTFPGFGAYGNHWSGDIYSAWPDMKQSIISIMNFNIFGIPMVGADICGFRNDTTVELCKRWTQLGAFYPFARNHNENTTIAQDPVSLGSDMVAIAKSALTLRYNLLPFFYTQFYRANVFGETVIKPLFFEFPEEEDTYTIDDQYLWGRALMVLPVLDQNVDVITPYFPKDVWYLWPNYSEPITGNGSISETDIPAPIDTINLAIRGGSVIFTQGVSQTTFDSRKNPYGLLVGLDKCGLANGDLFIDDGESIDTVKNKKYTYLKVTMSNVGELESVVDHTDPTLNWSHLTSITIFGENEEPTTVTVREQPVGFTYNANLKTLEIDNVDIDLTKNFTVTWE